MSTASLSYVWLAPNPRSSYRQLFVKGTRIPARVLYGWNEPDYKYHAKPKPLSPQERVKLMR